ncbi:ParB-like protein [Paraburkholderia kirstenboschensis]|uniref:ParB-like protein n=1 Tax=Paraburkholderia kirstenboschensis TaxID=1245436 RepID=UPI00374411D6
MESNDRVHRFDEDGKRCDVGEHRLNVSDMVDDPYHSLAAIARRARAYRKPQCA